MKLLAPERYEMKILHISITIVYCRINQIRRFLFQSLEIPDKLKPPNPTQLLAKGERPTKNISDVIDVVGNGPTQPVRKRKAALEQSNVLKKIKNKNF